MYTWKDAHSPTASSTRRRLGVYHLTELVRPKVYFAPCMHLTFQWYLQAIDELQATKQFELFSLQADQDEHSLEMHLPYVRKIFEGYGSPDLIAPEDH